MKYRPAIIYSILSLLLIGSIIFNIVQYYGSHRTFLKSLNQEDEVVIHNIETYLNTISPSFLEEVKNLSLKDNLPTWGCGPTSFALGQIINKKFFGDKIPFSATYQNHPYEIIERFSLVGANPLHEAGIDITDHAWLEIYFQNKLLFIDPTIAQFGKYNKIVYEEFNVGDSTIPQVLKDKYGIYDLRIRRLVKKTVDRVPLTQEPYPGMEIDPKYIDYYLKVAEDANEVDAGQIPIEWKSWVATLRAKY